MCVINALSNRINSSRNTLCLWNDSRQLQQKTELQVGSCRTRISLATWTLQFTLNSVALCPFLMLFTVCIYMCVCLQNRLPGEFTFILPVMCIIPRTFSKQFIPLVTATVLVPLRCFQLGWKMVINVMSPLNFTQKKEFVLTTSSIYMFLSLRLFIWSVTAL